MTVAMKIESLIIKCCYMESSIYVATSRAGQRYTAPVASFASTVQNPKSSGENKHTFKGAKVIHHLDLHRCSLFVFLAHYLFIKTLWVEAFMLGPKSVTVEFLSVRKLTVLGFELSPSETHWDGKARNGFQGLNCLLDFLKKERTPSRRILQHLKC